MNVLRRALRRPLLMIGVLFVLGAAATLAASSIRWRAHLTLLYLTGRIPDIELKQLFAYMLPSADQSLPRLIETRNPYAVIRNFRTSKSDVEAGSGIFRDRCASCHGTDGAGGPIAPALIGREYKHGESDWAVYRTILKGVPGTPMPATGDLSDEQRWQVISFLRYIGAQNHASAAPATSAGVAADVRVGYPELKAIHRPDRDWLTYSGSYWSTRHSTLHQIDSANVGQLRVGWIHQFDGPPRIEASPLVRNGVMFMSVPPCAVHALDATTGRKLWSWSCELRNTTSGEHIGGVNRGVALLDDKVYVTTWDARLFALSAETGAVVWEANVADDNAVYFISQAPLAYRDLVVTGVSTRKVGRGYLAAFDAKTGKQRWKFFAIPGPGEPGHDSWAGDSWQTGGAPMWLTGSYDPDEDLLYWGVGNPKPDYDPKARRGDNLYSNSVVALRGSTGEIVWHFQFTPADERDWDSAQIPVLVDWPSNGTVQKRMLWANRNGHYYVLDRVSGKFLLGTPFVQQNWNAGLDANGRPIPLPETSHAKEGKLTYPGNVGGTSWWPPTYDPQRNLMIIPVLEQGMVFFPSFNTWPQASGRSFYTAIRALNATTGKLVWEYRRPPRFANNFMAGTLSTDGGVVFGSDESTFFALSADTGELLWSIDTGGLILAAPVTFEVGGQQYVSIAAGGDLLTFALPGTPTRAISRLSRR